MFLQSKNEQVYVKISVIIAARNEEKNIKVLLDSLRQIDYPQDSWEVIFVNDHSQDNTLSFIKNEITSFKNFSIVDFNNSNYSGKRNALTNGIEESKYPYILITDADCRPRPGWLKPFSEKFSNGYEMLFGAAPFYQEKFLVNRISCFENLRGSILAFSFASLGLPYSSAARNFGFSKAAFAAVKGYKNTVDTLSGDDDLLMREAVKKKIKIGTIADPGSFVYSATKKTFKDYFNQRARHTQTSFHYLLRHKILLAAWHLFNLLFLFSPLLMFFSTLSGVLFISKILIDVSIIKSTDKKIGYDFSFFQAAYLQILYEIFLIAHFFNARFMKIKWK